MMQIPLSARGLGVSVLGLATQLPLRTPPNTMNMTSPDFVIKAGTDFVIKAGTDFVIKAGTDFVIKADTDVFSPKDLVELPVANTGVANPSGALVSVVVPRYQTRGCPVRRREF